MRCQTRVVFLSTCCLSLVFRLVEVWTTFHSRVLCIEIWQQEIACEENHIQLMSHSQLTSLSYFPG